MNRSAPRRLRLRRQSRPDVVVIATDKLELILERNERHLRARRDWPTPLSICVALWLVWPISDFKDSFGVSAAQWQAIVALCALVATAWFAVVLTRALRSPSRTDLIAQICAESDRLEDQRGLYFLHSTDGSGSDKILVYYDDLWGCYLLPHVNVQAWDLANTSNQGELALYASRLLAVPSDSVRVTVLKNQSLHSIKYSEFYRQEREYNFEFIHVAINPPIREDIFDEKFTAGGREFTWKSLAELLADPSTSSKNGDVLHHFESHYAEFFIRTPDSLSGKKLTTMSASRDSET